MRKHNKCQRFVYAYIFKRNRWKSFLRSCFEGATSKLVKKRKRRQHILLKIVVRLHIYIFVNTWDREGHPTYMIRVSVPSFVIRLVKMRLYGLIKACACMCACAGVFSKFLLWRQIRNPSYYKEDYMYLNMFAGGSLVSCTSPPLLAQILFTCSAWKIPSRLPSTIGV